jgi:hypothetical protein
MGKNFLLQRKNIDKLKKNTKKKDKAVPLHTMEAHGGRGGIAPTHS